MNQQTIIAERAQIIAAHGPWTAHDIDLGHNLSTMDKGLQQQWRVDWFDSLIRRFSGSIASRQAYVAAKRIGLAGLTQRASYASKRILDLACLEGLFALEYARMGAQTVGIEIRDVHLAKARFAQKVIGLSNAQLVQGDVRSIPPELGQFNIIICAGIFYHLDFPDCVRFLRDAAKRTSDLFILDSHLAYDSIGQSVLPLSDMRDYEFEGERFRGREIVEHEENISAEEKARVHVWASIDNDLSVWLSEPDVVRMMTQEGLALVHRAYPNDSYATNHPDRPTLVFKRL